MNRKILMIDDDQDFTAAIKVFLEKEGFSFVSASMGCDGFNRFVEENPDLVILDVMMEYDTVGFDIAQKIKKAKPDIPIIIVTGIVDMLHINFEEKSKDKDWLNIDVFMNKPLKNDELLAKIKGLLNI